MLQKPDEVQIVIHDQPISGVLQLDSWLQSQMDAATAIFMGRVRDVAMDGQPLEALELSHYPGLCERLIEGSAHQLLQHHGCRSALVLHRVGRLLPGELIVLVAVLEGIELR